MDYTELSVRTADETRSEIIIAELADHPFESFETGDGILRAYIPAEELPGCREQVEKYLLGLGVEYEFSDIETVNWNSVWESGFEPVDVEGKFMVRAPFHEPPAEGCDIIIMPKMSFGTGHHSTTWLMLSEMARHSFSGLDGLDMGSGTGVLAIAAALKGAQTVDAVDIDDWAYQNCVENIGVNNVEDKVRPLLGDIIAVAGMNYDFILANINRNILLEDMPRYREMLRAGGRLLMSGILDEDLPVITARARSLGMDVERTAERGGWAAVLCSMPE